MNPTRSSLAQAIDRIRDHLLIAKNALDENDVNKAIDALTRAGQEVSETVKELGK